MDDSTLIKGVRDVLCASSGCAVRKQAESCWTGFNDELSVISYHCLSFSFLKLGCFQINVLFYGKKNLQNKHHQQQYSHQILCYLVIS